MKTVYWVMLALGGGALALLLMKNASAQQIEVAPGELIEGCDAVEYLEIIQ